MRPNEKSYWDSYISKLSDNNKPIQPFIEASFAGNIDITDGLIALYLNGKKTAGSSVLEDFQTAGDPVPKIGNYWIMLNSKSEPQCIAKTIHIVTCKFKDVPIDIAVAEGEGDLSLEYWRKVHSELYHPYLKDWGIKVIDDATIITEFFEIVYR
jgi:5-formyltetrahydrofolate cyclo-ligase